MADIHVFADMDQIRGHYDANPMQTIDEAYGPTRTNTTERFRITSRFKFDDEAVAYAAFDGIAVVQDVPDPLFPGLVTLALYSLDIGRRYPNPQIMIYRGLVRDDFFRGTDVDSQMQLPNRPGFNSDLIVNMWQHFNDWKQQLTSLGQTSPLTEPPYDMLGYMNYDSAQTPQHSNRRKSYDENDNVLLQFLHKGRDPNYQPFPIKKGWTIGRFKRYTDAKQVGGGIEIMLEGNNYPLLFKHMWKFQRTVEGLTAGAHPGVEDYATLAQREEVLDYIDPAAFYNHYSNSGVEYRDNNGATKVWKGDDVYDHVVSKFYTANRVYVEIRNQHDYSLNFYQDNVHVDQNVATHFKIGFNGTPGSEAEDNYYTNYWPIYSREIRNTNNVPNTMELAFRKEYNPDPVVYVDQGLPVKPWGSERFIYDNSPDDQNQLWSYTFQFQTPNLSRLATQHDTNANTSTAWVTKLYLIRKRLPEVDLPERAVPSSNYADLVFGPVKNYSAQYPAAGKRMWLMGGAKRYVNGDHEFTNRGDFMVQTGQYIDDTSIVFWATLIDKNSRITPFANIARNQTQGLDYGAARFETLLKFWSGRDDVLINFIFNPTGGGSHSIPTLKSEISYLPEFGMLTLRMDRSEFEQRLLPSANSMSGNSDRIYFSLDSFQHETDADSNYAHTALLSVAGLNGSGVYSKQNPQNGLMYVRSIDRFNFSTSGATKDAAVPDGGTDLNAYFIANSPTDHNNLVEFVEIVEKAYASHDHTAEDTLTRIRMQFYGYEYRRKERGDDISPVLDGMAGIFANSIPAANNWDYTPDEYFGPRILERDQARNKFPDDLAFQKLYENAYVHLWGLADENKVGDNPSPLVQDPVRGSAPRYRWDLGHAFYGLTSLVNNNGLLIDHPYPDKFTITNSTDLSSFIADISPVVANHYVYMAHGNKPFNGDPFYPATSDLDRFWEIEAPDADLIGDAESFGWWAAWQRVRDDAAAAGRPFKLSEVFRHYYDPDTIHPEHYRHRWLLFCKYHDYVDNGGHFRSMGVGDSRYVALIERVRKNAILACNFKDHKIATAKILMFNWGSPEVNDYAGILTDTVRVYYVIDRFFSKVQGWLLAE